MEENKSRIIIVDDDVSLCQNLKDILEEENYSVEYARDGKTALKSSKHGKFDLALVDLKLPDISGFELIDQLEKISPGTEYIIITGYGSLESAIDAMQIRNVASYETKPLDMPHLITIIKQTLNRKQAEEALRESEEDKTRILDSLSELIVYRNKDMETIWASKSAADHLNLTQEEMKGRVCFKQRHGRDEPCEGCYVIETLRTGNPQELETAPPDGKFWRVNVFPVLDSSGEVIGAIESSLDITERKKTEILQSVLYTIYGATVEGIMLEDLYKVIHLELNRVLDAGNLYIAMYYDEEKELLTFPYFVDENIQREDDYEPLSRKFRKGLTEYLIGYGNGLLLTEDEIKALEKKCQIEIIRRMPKMWLGVPLKINGRIIGVIAVQSYTNSEAYTEEDLRLLEFISSQIVNTIERKWIEEALIKSEEKYRKLFEDSRDAVFITDIDGKILEINESGCELFDSTRDEIIGTNAIDFYVNPEDREDYKEIIGEKGFVRNFELKLKKKDGSVMDCLDTSSLRIDGNGNFLGYQGVIHNVTERRKAEQRLIEEFNRAEFYNDLMAHDINNFNQGVISNLELLLSSREIKDKQKRYMENALGQVIGSTELISNLRKLTSLRTKDWELRSMDMTPVIQEAIDTVGTLYPNRKLELESNITEWKHHVMGNELIFDVFFNILSNATKFNRHNIVELEVVINEDIDNFWKIEIKDHGPGVEDNMKSVIFDRLIRANGTVHGSGLGLTVVKHIVDCYGGRIWVEDRVAGDYTKGSNFILQLPRGD